MWPIVQAGIMILFAIGAIFQIFIPLFKGNPLFPIFRKKKLKVRKEEIKREVDVLKQDAHTEADRAWQETEEIEKIEEEIKKDFNI